MIFFSLILKKEIENHNKESYLIILLHLFSRWTEDKGPTNPTPILVHLLALEILHCLFLFLKVNSEKK